MPDDRSAMAVADQMIGRARFAVFTFQLSKPLEQPPPGDLPFAYTVRPRAVLVSPRERFDDGAATEPLDEFDGQRRLGLPPMWRLLAQVSRKRSMDRDDDRSGR